MAYCRFSPESDVFLVPNADGITCVSCTLGDEQCAWRTFDSRAQALLHLIKHLRQGNQVPLYAFDRLIAEVVEFGDAY